MWRNGVPEERAGAELERHESAWSVFPGGDRAVVKREGSPTNTALPTMKQRQPQLGQQCENAVTCLSLSFPICVRVMPTWDEARHVGSLSIFSSCRDEN